MLKTERVIIVEGKYDKIKLSAVIDATIITTEGFGIFKDSEKRRLIKAYAEKRGLIVMCDSDNAGNMIRNHIKNITQNKNVINIYTPVFSGKEKRKSAPSKENIIGVEGIDLKILKNLFEKYGVLVEESDRKQKNAITKADLYRHGLIGKANSAQKRRELCSRLWLPRNLSANALCEALNVLGISL